MRVIAGLYKGRRLKPPSWAGLRPTSDQLKETLFNVLGDLVDGARVLDGFAGSGALGIEALSRGALAVTFVEQDPRALALVDENLRHCGIARGYVMIRGGFVEAVRRLPADQRFELVLLDPPYDQPDLDGVLAAAVHCLDSRGIVVLEHARRRDVPGRVAGIGPYRTVTAGHSTLTLYRPVESPARTPVEET
jgi:16S rRNA (guanine(966)-N(2))-methyltransferase RsmD